MMGRFANILIIILEILGLRVSIGDRKWRIFAYYTQISNLITIVSSIVYVFTGGPAWLRYTSACMLTMTFAVTLFILVPFGGGFRRLMLSGNGLYHHTLCPVLSVISYILWEAVSSYAVSGVVSYFLYIMGRPFVSMDDSGGDHICVWDRNDVYELQRVVRWAISVFQGEPSKQTGDGILDSGADRNDHGDFAGYALDRVKNS